MRFSLALACVCVLGSLQASASETTGSQLSKRTLGRFSVHALSAERPKELTPRAAYARALTKRKPTPRSTAQRRQESFVPPQSITSPLTATDPDTLAPLGTFSISGSVELGYDLLLLPANTGTPLSVTFSYTSGTNPTNAQLTISDASSSAAAFPVLGLDACGGTAVLSTTSTDYVCVTSFASPGVPAGSVPVAGLLTIGQLTSIGAETNVWSVNRFTGVIGAVWVNPDNTLVPLFFATDLVTGSIVATGDIENFLIEMGANWVTATLRVQPIVTPP